MDPIFFDRTYYLVPEANAAQRRPYVLLLEAMSETGMAALGRFVRAGRESLCLVRAKDDALVLETLFLVEDVHSSAEIAEAVEDTEVKKTELDLARQIIDGLSGEFEPAELTSEYRRDLKASARGQARGRGDHRPGAGGRGRSGHRPHGGAEGQRRGCAWRGRGAKRAPAKRKAASGSKSRSKARS